MTEITQQIEDLIHQGRYLEARIKLKDALKHADDLRLNQLYALALSKSGTPEAGLVLLEPLLISHPEDSETAGILGSIYKELFKKNQQTSLALQSRDTYLNNFTKTNNYYTGINAASMSAILMQTQKSKEIAGEVIVLIDPDTHDFWEQATLAEAWLLTKNKEKSLTYYVKARKSAGTDWGKITSVYHQLWLLNHYLAVSKDVLKMFQPPTIIAFTGHMIDTADRSIPRFPEALAADVKQSIKNTILTQHAQIGYSSLACGGDILFAEAMEEAGGEVNLFLPFAAEDFIETSIAFAGQEWIDRFHRLVKKFPPTYITKDAYNGNDDFFQFLSTIVFGLAVLRSSLQHTEPSLVTVLSAVDLKRKRGGTRDAMRLWPYPNRIININPDDFKTPQTQPKPAPSSPLKVFVKNPDQPILFMLYTELGHLQQVNFHRILEALKISITGTGLTPIAFESDLGKIILGFDSYTYLLECLPSIFKAGNAARITDQIRVSIHCGSVIMKSSETENKQATGKEVDFLKKIHSLAPDGACWASDYFASIIALENKKYELSYMGMILDEDNATRTIYRVTDMVRKYF